MTARRSVYRVLGLVLAALLVATGCRSTPERRTPDRNPEDIAAEYWQARVEFWKSADTFVATSSRVTSQAKRVAELQQEVERTVPSETRGILLARGLVPVLLDSLAERASLSLSHTDDYSGVRTSKGIVDRLREEYLVLSSGLSEPQLLAVNRTVHVAIAARTDRLEAEAKAANERYTSDHPRVKQISAELVALKGAGESMLLAEK